MTENMFGVLAFVCTRLLLRTATVKLPSTQVTGRRCSLAFGVGADATQGNRSIFMLCGRKRSFDEPTRPFTTATSSKYRFSFSFSIAFSFWRPWRSSSKQAQSISTFLKRIQNFSIFETTFRLSYKRTKMNIYRKKLDNFFWIDGDLTSLKSFNVSSSRSSAVFSSSVVLWALNDCTFSLSVSYLLQISINCRICFPLARILSSFYKFKTNFL